MGRYRNRKFSSDWIHKMEPLDRWISYWYQVKLMTKYVKEGDEMIELGLGTGFLAHYFRGKGVNIRTLDIDKNKKPNVVIDAVDFHPHFAFDHFCAFEVFEHLEFNEMMQVIENIRNSVRKNIFISIPVFKRFPVSFSLRVKSKRMSVHIPLPVHRIRDNHHHWELGYKTFTKKHLIFEYERQGFILQNSLSYFRWRYFHFSKAIG